MRRGEWLDQVGLKLTQSLSKAGVEVGTELGNRKKIAKIIIFREVKVPVKIALICQVIVPKSDMRGNCLVVTTVE